MTNLKQLINQSKGYFPSSKNMQKQWVRKTVELERSGKHCKFNGGWTISKSKEMN